MSNIVNIKPNPYAPRLYMTSYAGGDRPGYCKTLDSATVAAMKKLLVDGLTACTISCTITGYDIVRMRLNDDRTRITVTSVRPWLKDLNRIEREQARVLALEQAA